MAETIRKRSEIEDQYKWDLTHIYASDEAWEKDYEAVTAEVATLSVFDGHVAEDPKKAIITVNETVEKIMPIYEYAFLRKETDVRYFDALSSGRVSEAENLLQEHRRGDGQHLLLVIAGNHDPQDRFCAHFRSLRHFFLLLFTDPKAGSPRPRWIHPS